MFVKIGPSVHIHIANIYAIWEHSKNSLKFSLTKPVNDENNVEVVQGYSFNDFKALHTHCMNNDIHFLDLTISRERQMESCHTCGGKGSSWKGFSGGCGASYATCTTCNGSGKLRLLQ